MQGWEIKFYDQWQCTYVVLCDGNENDKGNPIAAASTHETIKKLHKPKCIWGQLIVEWKKQKNTDFNGKFTQAGHVYFHFYNSQAMIM
jgi:hypothetical protein